MRVEIAKKTRKEISGILFKTNSWSEFWFECGLDFVQGSTCQQISSF
jgi:hypothetical protein